VYTAPVDATFGEAEWRPFVDANPFGHLVAAGRDRDIPVVVPTQFVLSPDAGDGSVTVWLHLVRANPIFGALAENSRVILSVAADWAFIPSAWKALEGSGEDPRLGIPTTYYGAVQLIGTASVLSERETPGSVAAVLRRQLGAFQPEIDAADPGEAHQKKLGAILGIAIAVDTVQAKFKYGGNVDAEHRLAVVDRLLDRGAPGDARAADHVRRRLAAEGAEAEGDSAT
jgi:transcriptional regulator